jgi:hypothetical protein
VLIEPRDVVIDPVRPNSRDLLRIAAAKVLNRVAPSLAPRLGLERRYAALGRGPYETAGNFVYSVSAREIEKIALGSNLPAVAFKGICDHYTEGVEFADKDSDVGREMLRSIRRQEQSFEIGAASTTLLMAIVFKQLPDDRTIARLRAADWLYMPLSRNPYISNVVSGPALATLHGSDAR